MVFGVAIGIAEAETTGTAANAQAAKPISNNASSEVLLAGRDSGHARELFRSRLVQE
jgi:hypothetical protein